MSRKKSYDPVVRAEAELEEAMAEMHAINEALSVPETSDADHENQDRDDIAGLDAADQVSTTVQEQNVKPSDPDADINYKERWLSLRGQFEFFRNQIVEKDRLIQQLTADVERLKAQPPAQTPHDGSVSPDELESLAARISDQYGDDLGKPFEKLTKYLKKLEGEVQESRKQVQQPQQVQQQQQTVDPREVYLTQLCPQWQQLNYDETFIAWLNQKAPYSSKTLGQQLNAAYDGGDVEGAAEIFNGFMREQSQRQAKQPDTRAPLQTPQNRQQGAAPAQPAPKYYTEREVDAFYRSIQNKTYRGTPADQAAMEQEIHLAYLEGRVR